ncbi:GCN5-related N-acetyltransferase [Nostocoides australiense Ben110]|uniref:GCN5-related N-acetyltransferase n=1 Tax=Nostocoides australiense Ben110 TaxID=1193182 RepID=W6JTB1_9MICO|nr:GNAT family N-acetyltransferase [Tetrasphaera australiensis]CCH71701.1 GCN5-related N-acetyltransferase [Tetrasphaera australiensis Ben110]
MSPRHTPRGKPILTTERLTLRPLTWDDLPELEALDADPVVMEFLDRPRTADEVRERTLARLDPTHDAMGLGYWCGLERSRFVGWWLLTPEGPGLAEIGWRLHPWAWGRGLATEGAREIIRHGFETVGLERIVAETMVVNARSRSVMDKLGMRHTRVEVRPWEDPLPGAEQGEWLAEITRADWIASG